MENIFCKKKNELQKMFFVSHFLLLGKYFSEL